ncbi:MAG: IPT/TIG domain-containing protein [Planctomycetaceae bacterium]|nr:IPT/TIG domain-containing protein [Planctomycetaceae bacterium]
MKLYLLSALAIILTSIALPISLQAQVSGGSATINGGNLSLVVDDAAGADVTWTLDFGATRVADGIYFTLTQMDGTLGGTNNANDGFPTKPTKDWVTAAGGAIASAADVGSFDVTRAIFEDSSPTVSGATLEMRQLTFADPASAESYIIVAFKGVHTGTNPFPTLYPTLWADLNAGGAATNAGFSTTVSYGGGSVGVVYFEDATTGSPTDYVGIVLLGQSMGNLDYVSGGFPTTETAEVALTSVIGVDVDTDSSTGDDDYVVAVTGSAITSMTGVNKSFIIGYALVAGASLAELTTAADAAADAWYTDCGVTGWANGIDDAIDGTSTTLTINYGGFPGPVIDAITPSSGSVVGGDLITVTGTFLAGVTNIDFGGTSIMPTFVSDLSLTFTTPVGTVGGVAIGFESAAGETQVAGGFSYSACVPTAAPTITAVDADIGKKGDIVTIIGTGFSCEVPEVKFGSNFSPEVELISDTELDVEVPSGPSAQAVDVTVINSAGSNTLAEAFEYESDGSELYPYETPEGSYLGTDRPLVCALNRFAPLHYGVVAALACAIALFCAGFVSRRNAR